MPAEGTGISWLEEEQPLSPCPRSLALDFDLLCSRLELAYKQGFGLGSLFLHRGGDREPGQALGFSTLLRLSSVSNEKNDLGGEGEPGAEVFPFADFPVINQ